MPRQAYEVAALAVRYALALLAGVTLLLVARGTVSQFLRVVRKRRALGDGALSVQLTLEAGGGEALPRGLTFFVEREALIGSGRSCDIRLGHPSVAKQHAQATFTGHELLLRPVSDSPATVSGAPIGPRSIAHHGDVLSIGELSFRVTFQAAEQGGEEEA